MPDIRLRKGKKGLVFLFPPGDQYYMYEFFHQPSHKECISMSDRSPATLFRRYTDVYYNMYESFFSELFSDCELCCCLSLMLVGSGGRCFDLFSLL